MLAPPVMSIRLVAYDMVPMPLIRDSAGGIFLGFLKRGLRFMTSRVKCSQSRCSASAVTYSKQIQGQTLSTKPGSAKKIQKI